MSNTAKQVVNDVKQTFFSGGPGTTGREVFEDSTASGPGAAYRSSDSTGAQPGAHSHIHGHEQGTGLTGVGVGSGQGHQNVASGQGLTGSGTATGAGVGSGLTSGHGHGHHSGLTGAGTGGGAGLGSGTGATGAGTGAGIGGAPSAGYGSKLEGTGLTGSTGSGTEQGLTGSHGHHGGGAAIGGAAAAAGAGAAGHHHSHGAGHEGHYHGTHGSDAAVGATGTTLGTNQERARGPTGADEPVRGASGATSGESTVDRTGKLQQDSHLYERTGIDGPLTGGAAGTDRFDTDKSRSGTGAGAGSGVTGSEKYRVPEGEPGQPAHKSSGLMSVLGTSDKDFVNRDRKGEGAYADTEGHFKLNETGPSGKTALTGREGTLENNPVHRVKSAATGTSDTTVGSDGEPKKKGLMEKVKDALS